MKRLIMPFALVFIAGASFAQAQQKLTWRDCAQVFIWTNEVANARVMDDRLCGEAWHTETEDEDEFLGYVFLSKIKDDDKEIQLIVGVNKKGAVSKVRVKNNNNGVDDEFLAQFDGKNSNANFQIARIGADILFVPAMIKAMRNKVKLSEKIAKEVESIVGTTNRLIKSDAKSKIS